MRLRPFGNSGLTVSEIGFGCARLGGVFGTESKREMLETLHMAYEQGVTFFDTADMYTQGESERLLGMALRDRRDKVVIASKGGYCLPSRKKLVARVKPLVRPIARRIGITSGSLPTKITGSLSQDFSAEYLTQAVEGSLRRLKTDYLDLYQLHSPPADVLQRGDFLEPLEMLKRQGKIRHYGVSCETTRDAMSCLHYPGITSLQVRLSLLDRTAVEVIGRAAEMGIAVIARECFAGGVLAKPLSESSRDGAMGSLRESDQIAVHQDLARELSRPLPQEALQFVLSVPGVSLALLGMSNRAHLIDNLRHPEARSPFESGLQITSGLS